jgi:hypothetical protein
MTIAAEGPILREEEEERNDESGALLLLPAGGRDESCCASEKHYVEQRDSGAALASTPLFCRGSTLTQQFKITKLQAVQPMEE